MIKILDSSLNRQAILKEAIEPNRFEEINGENTLTFSTILDEKASTYVDENSIIEIDEDYFDLVYYSKNQNEDGTLTIDVEAEHVSYRLNNYSLEYYTKTGTPTEILTELLTGTGFTVGTVEYSAEMTYSAQEAKSKRQMIMELVALLGGEIDFEKFEVSILTHRGSTAPRILTTGKNIRIISKVYNKRETDESGNPLVAYTCEPIQPTGYSFMLGDEVLLIQKDLDIQETLRIVRLGYNPYNPMTAEIELANFISGVEDQMYRIATTTVAKEKVYNGCRIGPEHGFEAVRSDNLVRTILNATKGIAVQKGDGEGVSWADIFYVDTEGNLHMKDAYIELVGTLATILLDPSVGMKITNGNGDMFYIDPVSGKLMLTGDATFSGDITTQKNAHVGDDLYLGKQNSSDTKKIWFNNYMNIEAKADGGWVIKFNCGILEFIGSMRGEWYFNNAYVGGLENSGYVKQSDIDSAIAAHEDTYHTV
jgi:hypothetical protein